MPTPSSLSELGPSTDRLLATVRPLTEEDVRRPSLLPDWSVGHVITHLARNADSLVNLANWARTGVPTPQYASRESRDADIEAGAGRPAAELIADLTDSADRLRAALEAVPDDAWDIVLEWRGGVHNPAGMIPAARLREVEVHHVDLGLGYGFDDMPAEFRIRLLADSVRRWPDDFDVTMRAEDLDRSWPEGEPRAIVVRGSSGDLLGWASGRTKGEGLRCDGELPAAPSWG